jgi:hypothetical protein
MMYLAGGLVNMQAAENPELTLPDEALKILMAQRQDSMLGAALNAYLFRPLETGKKASSREMSTNGVFTTGNIKEATPAQGKWSLENFVAAAVKFIEEWKKL